MSLLQEVVEGELLPDGTLALDGPIELPAGRVRVTIQVSASAAQRSDDWFSYLQRSRRELEAINYPTMTACELDSHVEWLRSDDDRIEKVYREMEEDRHAQGQ